MMDITTHERLDTVRAAARRASFTGQDFPAEHEDVLRATILGLRGIAVPDADDRHVIDSTLQAYRVASTGQDVAILAAGDAVERANEGVGPDLRANLRGILLDLTESVRRTVTPAAVDEATSKLVALIVSIDENAHARGYALALDRRS